MGFILAFTASTAFAQFDEETKDLFVNKAVRCAECHEKMFKEWKGSGHAHASNSPVYVALIGKDKSCATCHAPLTVTAAAKYPAASEGVTCDVCHSLKEMEPKKEGPKLNLQLADTVKYGPICNAKQHYFHKMGCSPLHEQSELCGGCHLYYAPSKGGGERLPVYTEFEDWQKSEAKEQGADCQSCHMPRARGEVAKGSGQRVQVGHHGLLDKDGGIRKRAIKMVAQVKDVGDAIELNLTLHNEGAGHHAPAGSPIRKLVVAIETLDSTGVGIGHIEREYGRVLVDSSGTEAMFNEAVKVGADTRLGPNEKRQETLTVNAPATGSLRISLYFRPVSAALAARYKLPLQKDLLLLTKAIPFTTKKGGSRSLPAIISLNPS